MGQRSRSRRPTRRRAGGVAATGALAWVAVMAVAQPAAADHKSAALPDARIDPGEKVTWNDGLNAHSGPYRLAFPGDATVTELFFPRNADPVSLWSTTPVAGEDRDAYLEMQPDGNLVLRDAAGAAVWSSDTAGGAPYSRYAELQDNGVLVIKERQPQPQGSVDAENYPAPEVSTVVAELSLGCTPEVCDVPPRPEPDIPEPPPQPVYMAEAEPVLNDAAVEPKKVAGGIPGPRYTPSGIDDFVKADFGIAPEADPIFFGKDTSPDAFRTTACYCTADSESPVARQAATAERGWAFVEGSRASWFFRDDPDKVFDSYETNRDHVLTESLNPGTPNDPWRFYANLHSDDGPTAERAKQGDQQAVAEDTGAADVRGEVELEPVLPDPPIEVHTEEDPYAFYDHLHSDDGPSAEAAKLAEAGAQPNIDVTAVGDYKIQEMQPVAHIEYAQKLVVGPDYSELNPPGMPEEQPAPDYQPEVVEGEDQSTRTAGALL